MKISEMIQKLSEHMKEHGDLPVHLIEHREDNCFTEVPLESWCVSETTGEKAYVLLNGTDADMLM